MKMFLGLILSVAMLATSAHASPVGNAPFHKVVYISAAANSTQSAANAGRDYSFPKGWYSGDLLTIPAGCVVENVYMVVDVALAGPTVVSLGDGSSATGFMTSSSSPLASTGILYWDVQYKGAYLYSGSRSYAKLYSSDTALKLAVTGTATAGKAKVVVDGWCN